MNELCQRSIFSHAEALRRGEYSSVELTKAYLEKIERSDKELGAFLLCDEDRALEAAKLADERLKSKNAPLLCGIPMAIKDNICTKGIRTTCASKMLENFVPAYDASVMEKLYENGAVLLGKTNMDEFAMGSGNDKSAFYPCRNPHDPKRSPGGSSGGSAAAVAAGEAAFSLGTDTGGSIRLPAAYCGVVGIKPTYGAVSRYGLVAFASSMDQIGALTRSVRDNAAVLAAIATPDKRDATCTGLPECEKLVREISSGVRGMKIGIVRELTDVACPKCRSSAEKSAAMLCSMGAEADYVSLPSVKYSLSAYQIIAAAEASSNLARFDGVRYGHRTAARVSSIDELYSMSRGEGFGYEAKLRILLGIYVLSDEGRKKYYEKALAARALIKKEMTSAMREFDLLISPMSAAPTPWIGEFGNDALGMYCSDICGMAANLSGMPAISVPCEAAEDGMPMGLQIIGNYYREDLIYRAADALEKIFKAESPASK